MRVLAEISTAEDLWAALRTRRIEVGFTFEDLDHISGMQPGYCAKVLGPARTKGFGPLTTSTLPPSLGAKLVLVEDAEALQRSARQAFHRGVERRRPIAVPPEEKP